MLNLMKKVFKPKEEEKDIYFIVVDFSDEAYDKYVSHWSLKKIYHIYGDTVVKIEDYSEPMINTYKRYHIPIIDVTKGQLIPKDYHKSITLKHILGRISLG